MGKRIPGLDGVRAVAVLLVLVGHAGNFPQFPGALEQLILINAAHFGVTIFFVLSGFLITTLLVDEQERKGRVSLRDFYMRRTLRIFPAAYLYILVVAVVASAGIVALKPGDLLHALTYTTNYHHDRGWVLGHLWSLAVEEQFYLIWPSLFIVAGCRSLLFAASIVLFVPLLRVAAWVMWPDARIGIDEEFQYVADALATGCVLALLVAKVGAGRLAGMIPVWVYAVAGISALAASSFSDWPSFHLLAGNTIVNCGIAMVLLGVAYGPLETLRKILETPPMVFVGTLSYSLYLWQQLFLDAEQPLVQNRLILALCMAFVAAMCSHYLVERPLLGLRAKFRR